MLPAESFNNYIFSTIKTIEKFNPKSQRNHSVILSFHAQKDKIDKKYLNIVTEFIRHWEYSYITDPSL